MKKVLILVSAFIWISMIGACTPQGQAEVVVLPTLPSVDSQEQVIVSKTKTASDQDTYIELYERVNPGVVAIDVFFADGSAGQGSGFILDLDGHILTNYHVIVDAAQIEVIFPGGYRTFGEVIGSDPDSDISVVSVDVPEEELHPLSLGDSDDVKVGQTVVAIGNPYGLSGTMTVGIISARGRMLDSMRESPSGGYFTASDLIQTDAAINPGNSGGPLLNLNGEVIAINRAIRTNGDDGVATLSNSGIGFAIPIDIVKRVVPFLIRDGKYSYPYLGVVSREELTLSERQVLGLPVDVQGAYVISVPEDGPAAAAGILGGTKQSQITDLPLGGDLIIAVDNQPVRNFSDLLSYLVENKYPGDSMSVTLLREGQEMTVNVVLTERPD
jgi:S1-C subfamily serine protease